MTQKTIIPDELFQEWFGTNPNAPILHLLLKEKWFNMIQELNKPEEYRDIKPSFNRVFKDGKIKIKGKYYNPTDVIICFSNGYRKDRRQMFARCNGLSVGIGKKEWGADTDKQQYILKLSNKIMYLHKGKDLQIRQSL